MGGSGRKAWVVVALAALVLPQTTAAASSKEKRKAAPAPVPSGHLEDRVRVLERKLDAKTAEETPEDRGIRQRLDSVEKDVKSVRQSLAKTLGIEIHGVIATNYTYNFNRPESKLNRLRVFDTDHNNIALDLANLRIQRVKPDGVGFVADLDFGKTAEVVGAATRWSNSQDEFATINGQRVLTKSGNSESHNSFEARQFYLVYTIPDTPVTLQAGKFVTYHGAEIIKAYNNQNYNISNSMTFGSAIPFTHTGLVATVSLPQELGAVSAGVVNGWDSVVDNNSSKSFIGNFALTPDPVVAFNLSLSYGSEQDDNGESKRWLINPIVTVKPIDELTFIGEYVYGNESNVRLGNATSTTALVRSGGNASWQGAAAYAVFNPLEELQLAVRCEVFDDPDGVRTLFQEVGRGPGATFWGVTPTISYRLPGNVPEAVDPLI